jgi:hypothetical protein
MVAFDSRSRISSLIAITHAEMKLVLGVTLDNFTLQLQRKTWPILLIFDLSWTQTQPDELLYALVTFKSSTMIHK